MPGFRFSVGTIVMCNLGPEGWKPGRVIALHYREEHWSAGKEAPYQVVLEDDHALIYVPEDDDRYCRKATHEDLRIARRMDALATLPPDMKETEYTQGGKHAGGVQLGCTGDKTPHGQPAYRSGRCHCCHCCPQSWSYAELYSEHYRCASRNGLKVTQHQFDLGTIHVGELVDHTPVGDEFPDRGFMQCPTLVRLPPGLRFSDDGSLAGQVQFDPHRDESYRVDFVAVSTANWDNPTMGIVRLELHFVVKGNEPPEEFDADAFGQEQQQARTVATRTLHDIYNAWELWEEGHASNHSTCDRIYKALHQLRELLERHPRLDGGRWWVQLGGFHMNVHKLLENTLFECELYLGHALTFGDAVVRRMAEQNLNGCYQKRLLEAARFMWVDGIKQMMQGEWMTAAETLRLAAAKKEGWGWAVNYGDIWLGEAVARLVIGAELSVQGESEEHDKRKWLAEVERLLEKCVIRADESGVFGPEGHPWATEVSEALASYYQLQDKGEDMTEWLEAFKLRTTYWCAQVLGGAPPFPPKLKPRREDAVALVQRLPGHNG